MNKKQQKPKITDIELLKSCIEDSKNVLESYVSEPEPPDVFSTAHLLFWHRVENFKYMKKGLLKKIKGDFKKDYEH